MGIFSILTSKATWIVLALAVIAFCTWRVYKLWINRHPRPATPVRIVAKVKAVTSGNTFSIEWRRRKDRTATLEGIGVPAAGQPVAEESRGYLQALIGGKTVTITVERHRRWRDAEPLDDEADVVQGLRVPDELVGVVTAAEGWCVQLAMVQMGMAWCLDDKSPWKEAEMEARKAKAGLWATYKGDEP